MTQEKSGLKGGWSLNYATKLNDQGSRVLHTVGLVSHNFDDAVEEADYQLAGIDVVGEPQLVCHMEVSLKDALELAKKHKAARKEILESIEQHNRRLGIALSRPYPRSLVTQQGSLVTITAYGPPQFITDENDKNKGGDKK